MLADHRVREKELEKVDKHQDLAVEITSVNVVPVVIGALGAVHKLEEWLKMMDMGMYELEVTQKAALLGTASILRRVLSLSV